MRFRLVPKSMILDDLERHNQELSKVFKYPLLSQEFGRYIHRVHGSISTFNKLHRVWIKNEATIFFCITLTNVDAIS